MGLHQVADMDEIADAGSVRCRVIGAEHVDLGALSGGGFDRDLQEVGGARRGEADTRQRIGAGDIEITQHHIAHAVRGGDVMQHDLGHQLRHAVGRQRPRRRILGDRRAIRIAVDGRGGGKDEARNVAADGDVEQIARRHGVVAIVAERIAHRFRHDDGAREVDDGIDMVRGDHAFDQVFIRHVADEQRHAVGNEGGETGGEIVDDDDAFAGFRQRENHVAADIAGSAGHKNGHANLTLNVRWPKRSAAAVRSILRVVGRYPV